jgi:hypothetical protein
VVAILATVIGVLHSTLYVNDATMKIAGVTGEMNNDILTNWIGSC